MKPVSDRRRKRDANYDGQRQAVWERAGGRCEAMALGCTWTMDAFHHIAGRGGDDPHRLDNLLGVCLACHSLIHSSPQIARERGWMKSRMRDVTPPRWAQEDAS